MFTVSSSKKIIAHLYISLDSSSDFILIGFLIFTAEEHENTAYHYLEIYKMQDKKQRYFSNKNRTVLRNLPIICWFKYSKTILIQNFWFHQVYDYRVISQSLYFVWTRIGLHISMCFTILIVTGYISYSYDIKDCFRFWKYY